MTSYRLSLENGKYLFVVEDGRVVIERFGVPSEVVQYAKPIISILDHVEQLEKLRGYLREAVSSCSNEGLCGKWLAAKSEAAPYCYSCRRWMESNGIAAD